MSDLPQHDELHVISDLHMGGTSDFQILKETKRLADYIGWVTAQSPGARVALVLNGDIVDTLAEDIGGYVALDHPERVVARIMDDPAFAGIWKALAAFVATKGRTLVIVIGNHDIELAFPPVQRLIVARLAGASLEARGRIEFSVAGAGYPCAVGDCRAFCIHGNEVDEWNFVRYEDLSRVARRLNAGKAVDPADWRPNAGAKMVRDVMNDFKRRYKWIDLLKPEIEAAVGVLAALDTSVLGKLGAVAELAGEAKWSKRDRDSRLSTDAPARPGPAPVRRPDQLLGPSLRDGLLAGSPATAADVDAMLLAAEPTRGGRARPAAPDGTLGTGQFLVDRITGWFRGISKEEALRRAVLDWIKSDKSFDVGDRDTTFEHVTESVGSGMHFVVTGHTHLARAIDMGGGHYYFNSGTWIRLMRFTSAMLKDEAAFKPVYDVLDDGTIERIDAAAFAGEAFVLPYCTAVRIRAAGSGAVGDLLRVAGGAPRPWPGLAPFRRP